MVNYEVKGQLAKLLATEDLIIENRTVSTASFDVRRRVLTLPLWERASATVYDLLVGHEVGHALYTPDINWKSKYPKVPGSFVNVLEDSRVERLIKRKFPGIVKTFYRGYSQLSEQDFFGIEDTDVDSMSFMDRINLHVKIGNFVDIKFNEIEKNFIHEVEKTETFDQVLELSFRIFEYLKETEVEDQTPPPQAQSPDSSQQSGGNLETSQSSSDGSADDGEKSDTTFQSDSDFSEFTNELLEEAKGGSEFETVTDKNFDDAVEELNGTNPHRRDINYLEVPELNIDNLIAKNCEIHETLSNFYENTFKNREEEYGIEVANEIFAEVDSDYKLFKKQSQKEVNYLVKEFECRKAADSYARAATSRTGVLDTRKLHTYRYNEDLFRKVTTLADGKNHGLVFVLDWSGSMSEVLQDTVKQLYNLIWFCKKVNIPFEVYSFTNHWKIFSREEDFGNEHVDEKIENEFYIPSDFHMMNVLSSKVRSTEFEKQMRNFYRLTYSADSRGYRWGGATYQVPSRLSLSGTPLHEALISLNGILSEFKKCTGVDKMHTIILTDGEAPPLKYNRMFSYNDRKPFWGYRQVYQGDFIRDRKTGNSFKLQHPYHGLTTALLDQLRARFPQTSFIGMRLLCPRDATNFIRKFVEDYESSEKMISRYKKEKSFAMKNVGYQTYFGLSSLALQSDSSFEVEEDATKAQIKSAFRKSLSAKKMNKKILGEFISLIA